jgi:hypothetical protein
MNERLPALLMYSVPVRHETTSVGIETYVRAYTYSFNFFCRSGRRRRWGRGCRAQHQIRGSGNQIQGPAAAQQELRGGEGGESDQAQ